ncbi:MAG: anti-sigma factor [Rhizobiaceae bacterium]
MSFADDHGPDAGGDDIVAAEYVVGVLSVEERRQAAARIEHDPAFARLVDEWEARLSPLASAYAEAEPSAGLKDVIDRRLFGSGEAAGLPQARVGLWQSLGFWRGLSAIAAAAFVIALAAPLLRQPVLPVGQNYAASLAANGSAVHYLAYYDSKSGSIALSHVSGERAAGHDFQLWLIAGKNKPVSLGVIPVGGDVRLPVKPELRDTLVAGNTIAISLEPKGGSPTGQPTGPVVAAGGLSKI